MFVACEVLECVLHLFGRQPDNLSLILYQRWHGGVDWLLVLMSSSFECAYSTAILHTQSTTCCDVGSQVSVVSSLLASINLLRVQLSE